MYLLNTPSASRLGCDSCRTLGDSTVDVAVDPTLLIAGGGLLALALIFFTGKKVGGEIRGYREYRRARSRRRAQFERGGF